MSAIIEISNQLNDFKNRKQVFPSMGSTETSLYRGTSLRGSAISVQLNVRSGFNGDIIGFPMAKLQIKALAHELTGINFEFMVPVDCDVPGNYLGIGFVVETADGKCLTVEPKNIKDLRKGQWQRLDFDIRADHFSKINSLIQEIRLTISSDQPAIGGLLISRLELIELPRIKLKAMAGSKSEEKFDFAYSKQKSEGRLPEFLSKDDLFRVSALTELAQCSKILTVGFSDSEALAGLLPATIDEFISINSIFKNTGNQPANAKSKGTKASKERRLFGETSDQLAQLVVLGKTFQCVYVAGNPKYDRAFMEVFFGGLLLEENGLLLIGNSSMASTSRVIKFYDTNRYQNFKKIGELYAGCTTFVKTDVIEKRSWDHFVNLF